MVKTNQDRINKFVYLYKQGMTITDIARQEKAASKTVSKYLKQHSVKLKTRSELQRKYPVKEDYFSIINTKEKAYWLGFIYADGCIYKNALKLTISKRDKEHLEKLKNVLSPSRNLTEYKSKYSPTPLVVLEIKSKQLVQDLARQGVVPNKTFLINKLPNIHCQFISSFIRGYFDGDGSITIRRAKDNHKGTLCIHLLGNKPFLEEIKNIFNILGCSNTKLCLAKRKTNNQTYQYSKGGNLQVYKIYKYLYKDATVYLERKFSKFKSLLGPLDSDI